jgi:formylglycine-generating enzyme
MLRVRFLHLAPIALAAAISVTANRAVGDDTITFGSDSTWSVYNGNPSGSGTLLGNANYVIYNATSPARQHSGSVVYGYPYDVLLANLASIPTAYWIWAPGITGSSPAPDYQQFYFTKSFDLTGPVSTATITVACDDLLEIIVNGNSVGSWGSVTNRTVAFNAQNSTTTFNIAPFLVAGANTLTLRGENGPASFADRTQPVTYSQSPASLVFGGTITTVPEAASLGLLGVGAAALMLRRRRGARWQQMSSSVPLVRNAIAGGTCALLMLTTTSSADVFNMPGGQTNLSLVPVGDAGNTADATGFGAVNYNYAISKYDVTVAQYCQFLNAVARTDPYGLWNSGMGVPISVANQTWGQITRSGSSGAYVYTAATGQDNYPANFVTWGSAVRFVNWLSNGQPATGAEIAATTENGSYNINGAITDAALNNVTRNLNATYVLPTRNEWYKAAYYKGGGTSAGYWTYPTQSNSMPSNVEDANGLNNATYYATSWTDPVTGFTPVGFYSLCPSPYGTFDMGGEMWQWSETPLSSTTHNVLGGSFAYWDGRQSSGFLMSSANQNHWFQSSYADGSVGFRVAAIPEPASIGLLGVGTAILFLRRHRRGG